jgi:STE24 endopeptidase
MISPEKRYSQQKYLLALIGIIFNLVFLITVQGLGISYGIQEFARSWSANRILQISLYIFILGAVYYLLDLPLNFYGSFILEHKFNLSRQKISDWMKDQAKTLVLGYLIALILVQTLYFLISRFPSSWWLITALAWILFSLVFSKIFPVVIIPLFFKYSPVKNEEVRSRVINLAKKFNIKLLDVFEIDLSKKTLKANAAFVGFGKQRRVILADTLQEKYSPDEIEAILAHEFAHFKFRHIWKLLGINAVSTLIMFYLIFRIIGPAPTSEIQFLPVFLIFMTVFGIVTAPLMNFISRCFEKETDLKALEVTGNAGALESMFKKLAEQNLSDKRPHPLIKFFFFDHPPIDERIGYIRNKTK